MSTRAHVHACGTAGRGTCDAPASFFSIIACVRGLPWTTWEHSTGAKHRASIVFTINPMAVDASFTRRGCLAAISAAMGGTICGMEFSSALFRLGTREMVARTAVACTLLFPSDRRLYRLSAISLALMSAKPLEASLKRTMSFNAVSRSRQSERACADAGRQQREPPR